MTTFADAQQATIDAGADLAWELQHGGSEQAISEARADYLAALAIEREAWIADFIAQMEAAA